MSQDRFPEVNAILAECAAEVKAKRARYDANQKRIHEDKSQAVFSPFSPQQAKAMAKEAVAARSAEILESVVAAVANEA